MFNQTHRVDFKRPDLADLTSRFAVVDLHFHTRFSDGLNTVRAVAGKARELGIGIAITDHNNIRGALEMDRIPDVFSIPGIELTSREGTHVLAYFYDIRDLKRFFDNEVHPRLGNGVMSSTNLEIEEIIERSRRHGGIVIFPHPFCTAYTGICNALIPESRMETLLDMADGVEVINAENLSRWNLKCAVLGFNLNKSMTGGSDGHTLFHAGKAVTYASCAPVRGDFLDAVKAGEIKVVGKEIRLLRKVTSNGMKLRTNIRNTPDLMEKNFRYSYSLIHKKSRTWKRHMRRGLDETLSLFSSRSGKL